ncbi:hypothetical protein [Sandaracinobacteroides saxicola]|uniref:Uncharacterized protein n=1 Tax=Sandaracinobacteroides saxicola TaxID=2759707 RepID=A0A7G5IK08_9SPHN|nr:hypothetical protein [Sandaracinobacteroides saxicola]QMW23700.1 hypothetical protein H3309_04205 [Sandaracinobacteroides saxicola]
MDIASGFGTLGVLLLVVGLIVGGAFIARRIGFADTVPANPLFSAQLLGGGKGRTETLARLPGRRLVVGVTVEGARYHILIGRDGAFALGQVPVAFAQTLAAQCPQDHP